MALFGVTPVPKQVPGLRFWVDALDPNGNGTLNANGAVMTTWVDKSGGGNNAVQATGASQPAYSLTGINGKPGVVFTFSGTGQYMNTSSSSVFSTDTATVFIVINSQRVTSNNDMFGTNGVTTPAMLTGVYGTKLRTHYWTTGGSNANDSSGSVTINTSTILYQTNGVTNIQGRINNVLSPDAVILGARTVANVPVYLNTRGPGVAGPTNSICTYGEFLVFDAYLSAANLALVYNYLSNKWGI